MQSSLQRNLRKIHWHIQGNIDVVGKQVQSHMRDDLNHLLVAKTDLVQAGNVGIADLRTLRHHLQRKRQRSCGFGITRMANLGGRHIGQAGTGLWPSTVWAARQYSQRL